MNLKMSLTINSSTGLGLGLHQQQDAAASNFRKQQPQQLELMELSLGSNKEEEEERNLQQLAPPGGGAGVAQQHEHGTCSSVAVEKEHMFDKVVTPSDVGKLNRLVIPKQHAEKYFPLDSSSNEKGLLLNFEDRNGKLWRFRYSYWNSSQSYVMTKGWSRFVKEKKLDAGDIVSFQRGLGDSYRHRLYIDWRRRPDHGHAHAHGHAPDPSTSLISPLFLPSIRWGARFYSPHHSSAVMPPRYHDHFHHHHHHQQQQQLNYSNLFTFQQQQYHGGAGDLNSGSGSVYYLRSMGSDHQNFPERGNNIVPMIIDSVPVGHHRQHHQHQHHQHGHGGMSTSGVGVGATSGNGSTSGGKRLRLFGVNMECASSAEESKGLSSGNSGAHVTVANSLPSSSSLQRLRVSHDDPLSSTSAGFGDQRGGTNSVLFDLDPSLQYRR
ncbi:hypothetical protein RJT34_20494 [Clitoria ternatea]|uniref:TF-B3 domain-containing protein n=1 Tax=Clitoria ternatea TaxID=43366 RepID=A0AAN9ISX0_CLITE